MYLPITNELPHNSLPLFHVHFKLIDISNYALIPATCSKTMAKINQDTKTIMNLCFTACITIKSKCEVQKACELHKKLLTQANNLMHNV